MKTIPIQDTPNQTFSITLGNQNCQIDLMQKRTGFFCNVSIDDKIIIAGVICQNLNRIVRDAYLGFIGDLIFYDTTGALDPSYPGLGSRYQFIYLEAVDL